MRACFLSVSWLVWTFVSVTQAQWDTNIYAVNLTGHGYLKDVFDAGLRPKRRNEAYQCFIEDKILCFDLGNGRVVTIPAESCRIRVFSSSQVLNGIEAETPALTVEETRAWMRPICGVFGGNEKELDDFLDLVNKGQTGFGWIGQENAPGFALATPKPALQSGFNRLTVRLKHHAADKRRPIRIALSIGWERPRSELDYPQTPLQPPKGYEAFSMEPEPYVASWLRHGWPAPPEVERQLGAAEVQRLRAEYAVKLGKTNPPTSLPSVPLPTAAESNAPPVTAVVSRPSRWPWWLGIFVLTASVILWRIKRRT